MRIQVERAEDGRWLTEIPAVAGIAFGADGYIRLSYATSMANIEKGLERIERFCMGLAK